jgi:hypothetical protein
LQYLTVSYQQILKHDIPRLFTENGVNAVERLVVIFNIDSIKKLLGFFKIGDNVITEISNILKANNIEKLSDFFNQPDTTKKMLNLFKTNVNKEVLDYEQKPDYDEDKFFESEIFKKTLSFSRITIIDKLLDFSRTNNIGETLKFFKIRTIKDLLKLRSQKDELSYDDYLNLEEDFKIRKFRFIVDEEINTDFHVDETTRKALKGMLYSKNIVFHDDNENNHRFLDLKDFPNLDKEEGGIDHLVDNPLFEK